MFSSMHRRNTHPHPSLLISCICYLPCPFLYYLFHVFKHKDQTDVTTGDDSRGTCHGGPRNPTELVLLQSGGPNAKPSPLVPVPFPCLINIYTRRSAPRPMIKHLATFRPVHAADRYLVGLNILFHQASPCHSMQRLATLARSGVSVPIANVRMWCQPRACSRPLFLRLNLGTRDFVTRDMIVRHQRNVIPVRFRPRVDHGWPGEVPAGKKVHPSKTDPKIDPHASASQRHLRTSKGDTLRTRDRRLINPDQQAPITTSGQLG